MPFTLPAATGAGSITDPATDIPQQKTNLGNLRGFIAEMLGTDSTSRGTARSLLGIDAPTLTFSVGASAMTINLKSAAGADGSSTAPVSMLFRSATLSSAAINVRQVTAALSLVVSSGSTLGMTNATDKWLYVYALDNSGTVELAISGKYYGWHFIGTSVAEGGAGAADSGTTIYSTTARTSVPMRLLGAVRSNQTTAGTWAAVPVEAAPIEQGTVELSSRSYTSPPQTITSAGALTLAHGMGVKPRFINAWLVCGTAELGFSIGHEVAVSFTQESDAVGDNRGMTLRRDATNISIRFGSNANVFVLTRDDTGVGSSATNGSWQLVIEAIA